jgi:hypothetical protein
MTRFRILEEIGKNLFAVSTKELAKHTNHPSSHTRSYQASLGTRLRRLWHQGLLRRRVDAFLRPGHRRRRVYVWTLSSRGIDRLHWARSNGFMDSNRAVRRRGPIPEK